MPAILRDTLKEYISHLPGFQLFTKKNGDIMNRSARNAFWRKLSRTWKEAVGDDYDLVTFTPHILRHTYATNILKAGIDLKTTQKLPGHSTIAMTMDIYNHITIDSKTLASRLDHAFQNQSKLIFRAECKKEPTVLGSSYRESSSITISNPAKSWQRRGGFVSALAGAYPQKVGRQAKEKKPSEGRANVFSLGA